MCRKKIHLNSSECGCEIIFANDRDDLDGKKIETSELDRAFTRMFKQRKVTQ